MADQHQQVPVISLDFINKVLRRRSYYRRCFIDTGKSGDQVLADLKRFCRADASPLVVSPSGISDAMATGVAIGRAEVFKRIVHHLHLDDAQLLKLKEEAIDET